MNRKQLLFGIGCLLSLVTFTTIALTQDDVPVRRRPVTEPSQPATYDPNPQFDPPSYNRPQEPVYPLHLQDGTPVVYRRKTVPRTVYETVAVQVSAEEAKQLQAMHAAKAKLKKAENEAARKVATDVIQQCLVKQFEQDLVQREKELTAVEERLKTLRQQLEKRKQAKDEIITLRLKTIINNAEGLGFPGDEDLRSPTEDTVPSFGPGPIDSSGYDSRRTIPSPDEETTPSVPRTR